jgi:hypothetical protein
MNNAVLFQMAGTADYLRLSTLYYARHVEYCAKHNFDYIVQGGPVRYWGEQPLIGWAKLAMIQGFIMQGYEYIVYLDADAYISELKTDLRIACQKPINMVRWWNHSESLSHLQGGVIYVHSLSPEVNPANAYTIISTFLQEAKYYIERYPGLRGWYEQGQINEFAKHEWFKDYFGELPMEFNWGEKSDVECEFPIVKAFHGVRPFDILYEQMKESIKNEKGRNKRGNGSKDV